MIPLLIATLEGDTEQVYPQLLGRSLLRRVGHAAAKTGRTTEHAASKVVRTVAHVQAQAARDVGHVVASGARVAEREAKRIIRAVARPIVAKVLHGEEDGFWGDDGTASITTSAPASSSSIRDILHKQRGALIAGITTAATGAVAASGVAAPAAPAVPVLLPPVLDQIINEAIAKGKKILEGPDPNPDGTPTAGGGSMLPLFLLAGGGLAAFLIIRKA
jgi:hypothetical protein